ncbi:MAG: hypothetical protein EBX40_06030, partial [Gammaproteobacteria bacterium]|nr:hypothetical protein [Gammaproteobacteria bacterium]
MKILWVTFLFPTHPQDSVGTFITDAAKALKAEGHTVDVLLIRPWLPRWLQRFGRKPLTSPSEFTIETVSYFSIPRHYFRLFSDTCLKWSVGRALKRRFKKQKYDLIHAHTELAAIAVAPFSREYKVPFVVTVHGIDTCPRYWNSKVRIAQALTQAARVIAVGPPLVPEIQKWTGQGARVVMIPNGFRGAPHLKTLAQKAPWGP